MFYILIYIIMAKKEDFKLTISVVENKIEVKTEWDRWWEEGFVNFIMEWAIPTYCKILEGMEIPDDLRNSIYARWIKQLSSEIWKLDLHSNDEEEDG